MKLFRSRQGWVFGVCRGIEDSAGFPAKYSRLILILAAVVFRGWYVLAAYILAALFIPVSSRSESRGFRENFEDLRNDARDMAMREYKDFLRYTTRSTAGEEEPAARTE